MNFPNRLKVSVGATDKLKYLKSKTGVTPNILCRFAISLALRDSVNVDDSSKLELSGQEFNSSTLFGENADVYFCLVSQYISDNGLESDIGKIIGSLVEVGLHKMGHVKSIKELALIACK
ncbi:DndE family protein [Pseudomonas sp. R4-83]|uniref:DndE family protein n=1 Tax=unclassified Pseudomonas TaxID=196821 RepID=UPI003DAA1725